MSQIKRLEKYLDKNNKNTQASIGVNIELNNPVQQKKFKLAPKKDKLNKSVSFEQPSIPKQKNLNKINKDDKRIKQQSNEKIINETKSLQKTIKDDFKQLKNISEKDNKNLKASRTNQHQKSRQNIKTQINKNEVIKNNTKQYQQAKNQQIRDEQKNVQSKKKVYRQKEITEILRSSQREDSTNVNMGTKKIQKNKQYLQILNKFKKMAGQYKNPYSTTNNNMNINQQSNLSTMPILHNKLNEKNKDFKYNTISRLKAQQGKNINIRSPKIQVIFQRQKLSQQHEANIQLSRQKRLINQKLPEQLVTIDSSDRKIKNIEASKQTKTNFKDKNKTSIKFLAEKQHQIQNADQRQYNLKLFQVQNARPDLNLNSTNRSLSLPFITKNSTVAQSSTKFLPKQYLNGKNKAFINERYKSASQQTQQKQKGKVLNDKRPISISNKLEKQRQLNSVAFSLLNLKERIEDIKGKTIKSSRMSVIKNNTSIINKIEQDKTPNKYYQSQTWINKNRVLSLTNTNQNKNDKEQQQKITQIQTNDMKIQKNSETQEKIIKSQPQIQQKENELGLLKEKAVDINVGTKNSKINKLKQKKQHLQQIKQEIQNENLEKQELLKQHRSINKNLQIDVINKRQRISQLQNQLSKIQSPHQYQSSQIQSGEGLSQNKRQKTKTQIDELQKQKLEKQKKYNRQKELVREQIKKIEQRILQQQLKYKTLKSQELQIKNQQLIQKEEQLKQKNRQLGHQLQRKTKELQQKIKIQQQKLSIYKLELQAQDKKNQEIWKQLKKQEELQELLLQQIEKIAKEKDNQTKVKEQQKNKQKIKIIQEIKTLQETQNKLLIEYQRDSQAINSIFQAMRLKNIELQNSIKQKLRKKQKQKYNPLNDRQGSTNLQQNITN